MRGILSMVGEAIERLVPVLLVLAVAGIAVLAVRLIRHPRQRAVDETLRDMALAAAVALIVVVTLLTPSRFGDDAEVKLVPFVDLVRALDGGGGLRTAIVELLGNVILFVPLGMAVRWRVPALGVLAVAAIAFVASASVEVLQALIGGRWANTTDVITNTLGGAIGAVVAGAMARDAGAGRTAQERS